MKLPVNYDTITQHQRRLVREEYIRLQDGKCSHCKNDLTDNPSDAIMNKNINEKLFPSGFFKYPVHLHHNHNTGMTIGAVHAICNAILWQYYGE